MRPGQPVGHRDRRLSRPHLHGHVDSIQAGSGAAFSLLPPENATGNFVKVVQRVPVKIVFDAAARRAASARACRSSRRCRCDERRSAASGWTPARSAAGAAIPG